MKLKYSKWKQNSNGLEISVTLEFVSQKVVRLYRVFSKLNRNRVVVDVYILRIVEGLLIVLCCGANNS